jgi:hypothetical protein
MAALAVTAKPATAHSPRKAAGNPEPDHATAAVKAALTRARALITQQAATVARPPTEHMPRAAMAVVAIQVLRRAITVPRNRALAASVVRSNALARRQGRNATMNMICLSGQS